MAKNNVVTIRLTDEDKAALVEYCEKEDIPQAQAIRKAIREMISKNETKN